MSFDLGNVQSASREMLANYLAPLAIWLIVLWFLAAIVLLLGA
jgi:preprotein translocase subunit SecG